MKKLLFLLMMLVLGLAGAAWWVSASPTETSEDLFTLARIERGALVESISATGLLAPQEVIPVGTEASGKVTEIAADFNQVVCEGDLLFRLDDRVAKQRLRQAEVAVQLARAEAERSRAARDACRRTTERLRELPESVSLKKDLDAAEAQLKAADVGVGVAEVRVREAEEGLALAELGLRLTSVHAPFLSRPNGRDGNGVGTVIETKSAPGRRKLVVLDRRVEVNQQVGPPISAQTFLLAGDLSQMFVMTQVAEGDIGRVRRGLRAEFTVAAYGDEVRFSGRVSDMRLLPTSEQGAVFYKVLIEVANSHDPATAEWQLRPGMTASVDILLRRREDTWKVPLAAFNLEMPPEHITEEARMRLARWQAQPDRDQWRPLWILDHAQKPRPIMVRIGETGDTALRDVQWGEVLDWDPELPVLPVPGASEKWPQVITSAQPSKHNGLFTIPKVKI